MRVFHLIKSLGRGGAEVLLVEGLRHADRRRFEYGYGYFVPWKDAMVSALRAQGAPVTCVPAGTNARILLAARRVASLLRAWGADVLHCHLPIAGVVGRIAGRLAGVPVVYTEHNKQERYHPATRRLNHLTWRWQARVIAVSGEVAASIASHTPGGVPVQVVLNGVAVDRFQRLSVDPAPVRRSLGIPEGAPVVGTVAVFRAQKRLDVWLEAARRIREREPATHFVLIGDGPLHDDVRARAAELGLGPAVHFPGLQEDVRPFLAMFDVYLMSSIFEGLPVALLEAMSMGCVPVCTRVGGIPEVVLEGENGCLAAPADAAGLSRHVADLLATPDRRQALGAAARRTVQTRFSMARMTRELEGVYLELAEGRPHASLPKRAPDRGGSWRILPRGTGGVDVARRTDERRSAN